MTLEVVRRHEKLAPKSGVEFKPTAPISGAGFWNVYQEPRTISSLHVSLLVDKGDVKTDPHTSLLVDGYDAERSQTSLVSVGY